MSIGNLSITTSTHANLLGKKITTLKLEEAPKSMHDSRGFSTTHFSQAHFKSHYEHQNEPNDSIYKGVDSFQDVLARVATPNQRGLILQVQQD